jgi:arsenate reductase
LTQATIYHNPNCSKSRDALRFLQDSGINPKIILYLKDGWAAQTVYALKASSGLDWQQMLRPGAQSELHNALINNDFETIVQYIIEQPAALERPFVVTDKGARLCRPIDTILEIIDLRPKTPWLTEKGVQVI